LLFAPAGRADLVAKLPRAGADVVTLDLEDGTAPQLAEAARAGAVIALPRLAAAGQRAYVRTNPPQDPAFAHDLAAVAAARPAGYVLPKCERAAVVAAAAAEIAAAHGGDSPPLVLGIETVDGVLAAVELASAHPAVEALYFGAEDYATSAGARRTDAGDEVLYARSRVLLAARAAGVLALDQAIPDVRDDARFAADAAAGRELGYDGKLCIHPRQVELTHEAFMPSEPELAAAAQLVTEFEAALAAGDAAPLIDGRLVDEPLVRRARAVLAAGRRGGGDDGR
jgi:citrate lyase subunit beta/citryl-CoA lyase